MKVKEKEWSDAGMGGGHWKYRVRKLEAGEKPASNAVSVPDDTEEYKWTPEHLVEAKEAK